VRQVVNRPHDDILSPQCTMILLKGSSGRISKLLVSKI